MTLGLKHLTTHDEQEEIQIAGKERVTLKRTFNMTLDGTLLRFWRIMGPVTHPNINSDLSIDGLREWGIIQ